MGRAFCCAVCATTRYCWRIQGDVIVSWACTTHLTAVMIGMQRDRERTRLVVTRTHDLETGDDFDLPDPV